MNENFSQRFNIIYKIFFDLASARGEPSSKLALAKFLGVSQGRTQHWERGQIPKAEDMHNIHAKLGISYSWLMTGKGDPLRESGGTSPEIVRELMDKLAAVESEKIALAQELEEARKINQKLTAKLLLDDTVQGVSNGTGGTGAAAAG